MDELLDTLISADETGINQALDAFIEKATVVFTFPELEAEEKRKEVWNALLKTATTTNNNDILMKCFVAVRILSREKNSLNQLITEEWLELIRDCIGLKNEDYTFNSDNFPIAIEAQKCLCNMVYNSLTAANLCKKHIINGIIDRVPKYKELGFPDQIVFFDMKLLFLITALKPEIREELKKTSLDEKLTEELSYILQEATSEGNSENNPSYHISLTDMQVDIACEILKALFNLTVRIADTEETIEKYLKLVAVLKNYLLIPTNSIEKSWVLRNNVINLLTNLPNKSYKALISPLNPTLNISKKLQYEGINMTAIYEILMLLKSKLNDETPVSKQQELLSPVVTVLYNAAICDRAIRKYLKLNILPPLKDVHSRPEKADTLRGHLCRLLTSPITQLKSVVAELLFVLCKKNVSRMIKYTGYGNAAGLFAQRGLLGGGHDEGEADYSDDSGTSDTEEYTEHKHGINPVLGCYEAPHPSAMENMTEEQKEYEAMKLVELIDNLSKCGAIKPCRIGADGKPEPIEHVLQLQEGLKSQQRDNDSDSD